LVTDHVCSWRALVTTCGDLEADGLLLHDVGSQASVKRQADEINRDYGARQMGMRAYVCGVEVTLDRSLSFESALAAREMRAVDPQRVLVTKSIYPLAAMVIACADEHCNHDKRLCQPLVSEIGEPEELARKAAEYNRQPSEGIVYLVCPVDVWLDR